MKQPIMVLKGVTYNYCEEVRFYNMIGFLSETREFQGIEIECPNETELSTVLKNSKNTEIKLVSGILSEVFDYYTMSLDGQEFSSGRLKPSGNNHQYTGSEFIYDGIDSLTTKEELYKTGARDIFYDEELETMLSDILKTHQEDKKLIKK